MKIRIRGNSVRLRLTKSEVGTLCTTGRIEESTAFPDAIFIYSVQTSQTIDRMKANFSGKSLILYIAGALVSDWASNDNVGFQHVQRLASGDQLFLLLEKDFACMDETLEDQSDNYPNPKKN